MSLKRKKGLRRRSEKRQDFEDELAEARFLAMARAGGVCEVCHERAAVHVHHKLRRSQGGTNALGNLMAVCAIDHERIHAFPEESYRRGWLLKGSGLSVHKSVG